MPLAGVPQASTLLPPRPEQLRGKAVADAVPLLARLRGRARERPAGQYAALNPPVNATDEKSTFLALYVSLSEGMSV